MHASVTGICVIRNMCRVVGGVAVPSVEGVGVRPVWSCGCRVPRPARKAVVRPAPLGGVSTLYEGEPVSVSFPVSVGRFGAVTAVAVSCVASAVVSASAAGHGPDVRGDRVVISGVHTDVPGRGDRFGRSLNREWVEITNSGRRDVDLSGWTLSDSDGNTYTFRRFRLDDGATVRVHTGSGRNTGSDVYQNRRRVVWDGSDTATLRTDRGRFVDSTSWGNGRRHDDQRSGSGRHAGNGHRR